MSSIDSDKLSKLQAQVLANGPRRKAKKIVKIAGGDDKKLQAALKKLNVQSIPSIEEINMFQDDGKVLHFRAPKGKFPYIISSLKFSDFILFLVQAAITANTFVISGHGQEKGKLKYLNN